MKIRIDYLNNNKEVRHIFTEEDFIWYELIDILKQWATDIRIYNITK